MPYRCCPSSSHAEGRPTLSLRRFVAVCATAPQLARLLDAQADPSWIASSASGWPRPMPRTVMTGNHVPVCDIALAVRMPFRSQPRALQAKDVSCQRALYSAANAPCMSCRRALGEQCLPFRAWQLQLTTSQWKTRGPLLPEAPPLLERGESTPFAWPRLMLALSSHRTAGSQSCAGP